MEIPVTTKKGIALLSSNTLNALITTIEKGLPGFWWSISQKPGTVTISGAPTPECPSAADVLYAFSDAGGSTTIVTPIIHFSNDQEATVLQWADHFVTYFKPQRDAFAVVFDQKTQERNAAVAKAAEENTPTEIPPVVVLQPSYRSQSEADMTALMSAYSDFLSHIGTYEEAGYALGELYLGSCTLSTDCSIRGLRSDGTEFDFSVDLQGNGPLADSVHEAESDLSSDLNKFKADQAAAAAVAKDAGAPKPAA
jgi:hypothetical protein